MIAPARVAALHALRAIADRRADLPDALVHGRERLSSDRDRALLSEIVTGTLRWQRALDHLVVHTAKRGTDRIDPDVLAILRLSLYQLLHLDRVPAAAVVDDAVSLTRLVKRSSAAGFVNAVLRNTLRQRHRLPLPSRPDQPSDRAAALAYLGVTHSHPDWLVGRWLDRHGFEACEQWVTFNNSTPALTLRANRLRTTRDGLRADLARDDIDTAATTYAPDGLTVLDGNPLRRGRDGSFVVQDEASQLVALLVAARPGERVLDLCAAPGGKTSALAAQMQDSGTLVASDVRARRLDLLAETIRASGATCVQVVRVPAEGPLTLGEPFDRVLVDAPCSGLGTVRRDPDIKWRREPGDLAGFAAAQLALLRRAAAAVRPGGRLVYATCSSEPEENRDVVRAFLQAEPDFVLADLGREALVAAELIDEEGFFRSLPFAHRLEAFGAAAFVRGATPARAA